MRKANYALRYQEEDIRLKDDSVKPGSWPELAASTIVAISAD